MATTIPHAPAVLYTELTGACRPSRNVHWCLPSFRRCSPTWRPPSLTPAVLYTELTGACRPSRSVHWCLPFFRRCSPFLRGDHHHSCARRSLLGVDRRPTSVSATRSVFRREASFRREGVFRITKGQCVIASAHTRVESSKALLVIFQDLFR